MPGVLLECVSLAPDHDFRLPHGVMSSRSKGSGPGWLVKAPGGGLIPVVFGSGRLHSKQPYAVCPDRFLRPILPPPGTDITDEEQPVDNGVAA